MANEQILLGNCTIELVRGDITRIPVDAIVNAANSSLAGGGGVDGAVHDAGGPVLMQELRRYGKCPTGSAVLTSAGRWPAKYVFHAVGPYYEDGNKGEAEQLASCYRTALQLANEYGCESISFPAISSGVYCYPMADAAAVALAAITGGLRSATSVRTIRLVQFNDAGYEVYRELMSNFAAKQSSAQTS